MKTLTVTTKKKREAVDITDLVNDMILNSLPGYGEICHLFVRHTTAALTTVSFDEKENLDLMGRVETTIEHSRSFATVGMHTHKTTYLPPSILAALVGASLEIPIENDALALGKFQRIVLLEFEGPGEREIAVVRES